MQLNAFCYVISEDNLQSWSTIDLFHCTGAGVSQAPWIPDCDVLGYCLEIHERRERDQQQRDFQ